jgi:hypothetical protein
MGRESKLNPFALGNVPLGQPEPKVLEAMERQLEEGDLVLTLGGQSPVFRVMKISPAQRGPQDPPGLQDVVLMSQIVMRCASNVPVREIVRVASAAEQRTKEIVQPEGMES